jgi:hypothetical protein
LSNEHSKTASSVDRHVNAGELSVFEGGETNVITGGIESEIGKFNHF